MKKTFVIFLGMALVVFMAGTAFQDTRDSDDLAAEIARVHQFTIPVGGVILWWGLEKDIPENFEVCDGRSPKTKGATMKHRKPELRDRFPMGAPNEFRFRPWQKNEGGGKDAETEPTSIAVQELPPHDHEMMAHQHAIGPSGHSHSITPSGHTHDINSHTHTLSDHDHALPADAGFVSLKVVTDPGETERDFLVKSAATSQDVVGSGDLTTQGSGSLTTQGSGALTAADSTPPDTGPADPGETTETGTATGHTHDIELDDVRPPFTQFLFIIRVK